MRIAELYFIIWCQTHIIAVAQTVVYRYDKAYCTVRIKTGITENFMVVDTDINHSPRHRDLAYVGIILAVSAVIGVYLILTTTFIARDGVSYISYAKALSNDPVGALRDCSEYAPIEYTPGYPFIILIVHRAINVFGDCSSVYSWMYSAQSAALICRMLALVMLYFIGKKIVSSSSSFLAILILSVLPYPARYGSDTLRDWPGLLFLMLGLYFLIVSAVNKRCWLFTVAGVATGLGFTIRPMCAMLLVVGLLWIFYGIINPKSVYSLSIPKSASAIALLITGFGAVVLPLALAGMDVLPVRLKQCFEAFAVSGLNSESLCRSDVVYSGQIISPVFFEGFASFFEAVNTSYVYFFTPFVLLGFVLYLKRAKELDAVKFMVTVFIFINVVLVSMRFAIDQYPVSERYLMPLTAIMTLFIPEGIDFVARSRMLKMLSFQRLPNEMKARIWFAILVLIGSSICFVKLVKPIRADKENYRAAAEWLENNTPKCASVIGFDSRIEFYSQRDPLFSNEQCDSNFPIYVVKNKKIYDGLDDGESILLNDGLDYIQFENNFIPESGDFTLAVWLYCQGDVEGEPIDRYGAAFGSASWSGAAVEGIAFRRHPDGRLYVEFGDGVNSYNFLAAEQINTVNKHKWYHLAVVRKGREFSFYLNGKFVNSITGNYSDSGVNFRIGHSGNLNLGQSHWYGKVKDVRVVGKGLLESEISAIMNSTEHNGRVVYRNPLKSSGRNDAEIVIYRFDFDSE